MADLLTRLMLNTQQFDQNLGNSSKQIQGFQQKINTFSSGAISSFTKFAGGVGLAMGGMEAFNKTIASTQTTGDAFEKTITQSKSSIDLFFTSIAKGDFSKFIDGLKNTIIQSGILAEQLDELATKSLFTNKELSDLMLQKKIQDNIAKDKTKSDAERNAALEKSRKLQVDINNLSRDLAKQEKNTGYALLNTAIAEQGFKGKVSNSMWDSVTNESNRDIVQIGAAEIDRRKAEIEKETTTKIVGGGAVGGTAVKILTKKGEALKKEFDKWIKTTDGQTKLFYKNFLEMPDDDKSKFAAAVQRFKNSNNLIGNISDSEFELNRIDSRINGGYNANNKTIIPKDSISGYKKQLEDLYKQLDLSTSDELSRQLKIKIIEIQKIIDESEERLAKMFYVPPKLNDKINVGGKSIKGDLANGNIKIKGVDPSVISSNYSYADSLNTVATQLNTITSLTGEGAASWANWASTVMTSIATAIPMIAALTTAKKAEANANAEAAITGVGSSVAAIPILGPIMAVAAIGSIIAAFASIPKFASGGIIGGSSFIGDNMIARVNSGEMILNGTQQRNLFNLLDGKGGSIGSSGSVEFKISGKDLVGTLNNQMSKTNKYK